MFGNVNYSKTYIRGDVVRALDSRKAGARNVYTSQESANSDATDRHTQHAVDSSRYKKMFNKLAQVFANKNKNNFVKR